MIKVNSQERELEALVKEVEAEYNISIPPMFELYATLFSILMAVMFFIYPHMLRDVESQPAHVYGNMMYVMPQWAWALSFFVASMLKACGLIFNMKPMRITGLIASSILYIALAACFSIVFPNIGSITFACMAVFTLISIPLVKHTTINHKGKER